ncbi:MULTISPECIES: S41 family peptidase [Hyphobacterium]|uniref:S41 family peptidase n=1 Tax=Hyphobacterium vulgare TaxID=1736751 RepID=A0ABV6ZXV1_9PROT
MSNALKLTACVLTLALLTPAITLAQDVAAHTDFTELADAINATMRAHHYDPAELEGPAYAAVEQAVSNLASTATTDEEFLSGFRTIWRSGPFSHVVLRQSDQTVAQMGAYFDSMRIGGGGAVLSWDGDIAVLTVNTMMGQDTIEEIDAAFDEIAHHDASALIVDLRENGGGAFAVRPLVAHIIDTPLDAGAFISQPWNATMDHAPGRADIAGLEPWEGWSVLSFWADVQANLVTRITFQPVEPSFDGPVYVLTSNETASAAEMASDALKASGRATLIGETTAGEMLSQTLYDLPGGYQLALPIADYYSMTNGRIEGHGVVPDIATDAATAMDAALTLARQ